MKQFKFSVNTPGRGLIDISQQIADFTAEAQVEMGLCHVFLHHTSASLLISENYDVQVQKDLEAFMCRLIPDGDEMFKHIEEGPDDMPSHVRTALTASFLMMPITQSKLDLGRYQGIYLWEHRLKPHQRKLTVTIF